LQQTIRDSPFIPGKKFHRANREQSISLFKWRFKKCTTKALWWSQWLHVVCV